MPLLHLPPSRVLSISDGDTPEVKKGVRLLGDSHVEEGTKSK